MCIWRSSWTSEAISINPHQTLFSSAKKKKKGNLKKSLYTCELFWSPFLLSITLFLKIFIVRVLLWHTKLVLPYPGLNSSCSASDPAPWLWPMKALEDGQSLGLLHQYGRPGRSSVPPISVSLSLVLWSFGKWICGGKLFLSLSLTLTLTLNYNFNVKLTFISCILYSFKVIVTLSTLPSHLPSLLWLFFFLIFIVTYFDLISYSQGHPSSK